MSIGQHGRKNPMPLASLCVCLAVPQAGRCTDGDHAARQEQQEVHGGHVHTSSAFNRKRSRQSTSPNPNREDTHRQSSTKRLCSSRTPERTGSSHDRTTMQPLKDVSVPPSSPANTTLPDHRQGIQLKVSSARGAGTGLQHSCERCGYSMTPASAQLQMHTPIALARGSAQYQAHCPSCR